MKRVAWSLGVVVFVGVAALFVGSRAAMFEREMSAEVEIEGSPEEVWNELSDFDSYGDWNPFMTSASGEISEGERLEIRIEPPDSSAMSFSPEVLVARPDSELRWLGRVFLPGVFDGEHYFLIESVGENTTRLTQGERFNGVLVPFLWGSLETNTLRGFEQMNQALKERVENRENRETRESERN